MIHYNARMSYLLWRGTVHCTYSANNVLFSLYVLEYWADFLGSKKFKRPETIEIHTF